MVTLLVARITALRESDGKKLVALSTLRQLGLIILTLFIGGPFVCFFHLIMHAFAKANLFTIVGNLIHSRFSQQDLRETLRRTENSRITIINFIRIVRLRGVTFFSGFFSKEAILIRHYYLINTIFSIIFLFSIVTLTLIYCVKLIVALCVKRIMQPILHKSIRLYRITPSLCLCLLRIYLGAFSFFNIITEAIPLKRLSRLY